MTKESCKKGDALQVTMTTVSRVTAMRDYPNGDGAWPFTCVNDADLSESSWKVVPRRLQVGDAVVFLNGKIAWTILSISDGYAWLDREEFAPITGRLDALQHAPKEEVNS